MNNLNPLFVIFEGAFENIAAGGMALASTGIPQRLAAAGINKFQQARAARKARMQARIARVTGAGQEEQPEEPQISPYAQMQQQNRGIIHQNAFPYEQ